jgi:hypothetical protein
VRCRLPADGDKGGSFSGVGGGGKRRERESDLSGGSWRKKNLFFGKRRSGVEARAEICCLVPDVEPKCSLGGVWGRDPTAAVMIEDSRL